jgi:mono/diheme cytochrome c family protein
MAFLRARSLNRACLQKLSSTCENTAVIPRPKSFSLLLTLTLIAIVGSPVHGLASKKDDDAKAGAILFRDKGCNYCHGDGAVGTKKAPALLDLSKDKTRTDAKITDQILNGGQKMPPFRDSLTDDEVSQLIVYLRAKNKPVPPPSDGSAPASSPH